MYNPYTISAEILDVTVQEYMALEATAKSRDLCHCITCLSGNGDRLCVGCHYRYATLDNQCNKCYADSAYGYVYSPSDFDNDEFVEMQADASIEAELDYQMRTPLEWADAKGRVIQAW